MSTADASLSETKIAAEAWQERLLSDLQREVYGWLFAQKDGATDEELEQGFPNAQRYAPSTLRKRRSEFTGAGADRTMRKASEAR
jgi:hypothetical protein